jgi:diguanylate cyclase (GGDEF)-like protein/PAS domain S-box-containing protein
VRRPWAGAGEDEPIEDDQHPRRRSADRQAEEAARLLDGEWLVTAAGASPSGLALCDQHGVVLAANASVAELFGRPTPDLGGLGLTDLAHPADRSLVEDHIIATAGSGGPAKAEFRFQRLDGGGGWVRSVLRPYDRAGRRWLIAFLDDTTERRDALDALAHDLDLDRIQPAAERLAEDGRLRKLLENVTDTVTVLDPVGNLAFSVDGLAGFTRADPDEPGAGPIERVHPDDADRAARLLARSVAAPGLPLTDRLRVRQDAGHWESVEVVVTNRSHDDDIGGLVITTRALSRPGWAADRLADQAVLVEALVTGGSLTHSLEALIRRLETDLGDGHATVLLDGEGGSLEPVAAVAMSPEALDAIREEARAAGPLLDAAHHHQASAGPCPRAVRALGYRAWWAIPLAGSGRGTAGVLVVCHPDERVPTRDERALLDAARRLTTVAVDRDHVDHDLFERSLFDELTGLPNRVLLLDRLDQALHRSHSRVVAIQIDLDRFASVNEVYGHGTGDELLAAVAARLREVVRPPDTIARTGSDEFTVVIENVADLDVVRPLAHRVRAALREPFVLTAGTLRATASIGVALSPPGSTSTDGLLNRATGAVARARRRGPDNIELVDAQADAVLDRQLAYETDLRQATARGELDLQFQPACDLASGEILGFEALVRWRHPVHGVLGPDRFIPQAEESGLIDEIGAWVLDTALAHAAGWRADNPDWRGWVAVNISSRQLRDELPRLVDETLHRHGWDPDALVLELTESAVIADPEQAASVLNELRAPGVRIAIDDFGTGHSALSYLDRFPVDVLKIDRSFVAGLEAGGDRTAIPAAIVNLADALGLTTVAEGVEDQEQVELLRAIGCQCAQGYHLGRPMWPDEVDVRRAVSGAAGGQGG